jgi:glycogen debranching enzyme
MADPALIGSDDATAPDARALWELGLGALDALESPTGYLSSEAGTGLYAALFGRDSLWILLLLLEAERTGAAPSLSRRVEAAGTRILSALAHLQGARVDDATEEQPGKILHEHRETLDERLRSYGMPFAAGRSYAGFDTTFLFVTAFARFAARFPGAAGVEETWPAVLRALGWIERYADEDGDGLFEYRRRDARNPRNQVWKDSFDSISTLSGFDVPPEPIAWIEVQAYAYQAFEEAAALFDARDDPQRAASLRARAKALRESTLDRYWMPEEGCPAIALDGRKQQLREVASNAGHALWAGMLDPGYAEQLAARLRRPDMRTPWGLRCLSAASPSYAPFAYHRGNVWPFDNGVVCAGLVRHGYAGDALRLAAGVGAALLRHGSATELYVVLDGDLLLEPQGRPIPQLARRRRDQANRTQGFTAAAAVFFATLLAHASGTELHDR